ncbi:MAG: hypothetical protein WAZ97_28290 [Pseudolabrys sp.]
MRHSSGLDLARRAGIHPTARQIVECADRISDAGLGECDGALRGGADLHLALSVDQPSSQ